MSTVTAPMPVRKFVLVIFLAAFATVATALVVNLLVDPYGIHGAPRINGFNALKPASNQQAWLAKAARARRAKPVVLLLGNSRVDIGLDPQSPAWPANDGPVFNMGVPGSGIAAQPGALDAVAAYAPLSLVVVGVDFLDFLPRRGSAEDNLSLADTAPRMRLDPRSFAQTSLSLSALADSVYTVWKQRDPNAADMTPLGFNPFREYRKYVALEGHAALAAQKNASNFRHMMALEAGRWSSLSIAALRAQLRTAARLRVPVVVFTFPYHAEMLESMAIAGLWPALESWKRLMTEVVEEERLRQPGLDVQLWDFTGYSRFATEPFPPLGDTRTQMRWFWEPGHFKAELGERLIRRMFTIGEGDAEFGARLDLRSIDGRLAAVRAARRLWRRSAPDVLARLEALAARVRRESNR